MGYAINHVLLVGGNLTKDAELKHIGNNNTAKTTFDIAMNRKYKNKNTDELVEEVSYFKIILWGKAAEALTEWLKKGVKVAVEGRLQQRRWTTDDGGNRSILEIVATNIVLMNNPANKQEKNKTENQKPDEMQPELADNQGFKHDDVPF